MILIKTAWQRKLRKKFLKKQKQRSGRFLKQKSVTKYVQIFGPLEFVNLILNAEAVVSNSFHATVFAIIFHKEFFVIERKERINTRVNDLLKVFGVGGQEDGSCEKTADSKKDKLAKDRVHPAEREERSRRIFSENNRRKEK